MTVRRLYIQGDNGKIYPYLVLNDTQVAHCRSEERVLQFFNMINLLLDKEKDTCSRHLLFSVPHVVAVSPYMRLVENNTTNTTLSEIFKQASVMVRVWNGTASWCSTMIGWPRSRPMETPSLPGYCSPSSTGSLASWPCVVWPSLSSTSPGWTQTCCRSPGTLAPSLRPSSPSTSMDRGSWMRTVQFRSTSLSACSASSHPLVSLAPYRWHGGRGPVPGADIDNETGIKLVSDTVTAILTRLQNLAEPRLRVETRR